MALRNILQEGDPTLTQSCREVTTFDDRLHTLIDDMWETLDLANGVGLAAPQVGVLRRVAIVLDYGSEYEGEEDAQGEKIELINPCIVEQKGEETDREGCLSVPGVTGLVTRPLWVKIRAQNRKGAWFEMEGEGLLARIICHELDHLEGRLYTGIAQKIEKLAQ